MEWDERVLTALLELTVVLGIEPLSVKRQALYLQHLSGWSAEEIRFGCNRAAQEAKFSAMPLPGVLIDFARQMPRKPVRLDLYRPALTETTSNNEALANEAFKTVFALFSERAVESIREVCGDGSDGRRASSFEG